MLYTVTLAPLVGFQEVSANQIAWQLNHNLHFTGLKRLERLIFVSFAHFSANQESTAA